MRQFSRRGSLAGREAALWQMGCLSDDGWQQARLEPPRIARPGHVLYFLAPAI